MMKSVRVLALFLAMILALSLLMTGCGGQGEEAGTDDPTTNTVEGTEAKPETDIDPSRLSHWTPMGGNRPVNYLLSGGIDYEYCTDEDAAAKIADLRELEEPERTNVYLNGSYCVVKGLVDQEVQASINQQIYDLYLKMCEQTELPAYRGVKTIQRLGRLEDISIYPWNVSYSGNLLSVGIQKSWTYEVDEEWHWIRDMEYLTFDMKTGGLVTLKSLFGDNVDYLEVLNEQVKKQLPALVDENMGSYEHNGNHVWEEEHLVQVAPFEGVREDQPFSVSYQGLNLYFDEKDPEFDTNFGGYDFVTIYYNDIKNEAVYPVRFPGEQELYTMPLSAMLVYNYDFETEAERTTEKNLEKSIEITWPRNLSVEDRDKMIDADRSRFLDEINGWYINNAVKVEETWGYVGYYCNITDLGGYYSVEHNLYGGTDGSVLDSNVRRIFNKKNRKEVPIDNVFMPNFDLRALLIDQIAEEMVARENYMPGSVFYTPEEAWDGRMANLNMYGISFDFPINDFGGRVTIYKDYSELGLENLKMFQ